MNWEIIFSIIATIFGSSGIGAGVKGILSSNKTKKELVKNEKETKEALNNLLIKVIQISADVIIRFENKNSSNAEININKNQNRRGKKDA